MTNHRFKGAYTALVTPFRNGKVDLEALDRVVEMQLAAGIHGLVPCGTTGEAAALSLDEHVAVVSRVVNKAAGRVPVVAGVGATATHKSVELAKRCADAGADALLAVTPYYVKPNSVGLYSHFVAVAEATALPIILYNVPGRTGCDLPADVTVRLGQHKNVVGLKDASANLQRMHEMLGQLPDDFCVLSGEDGIILPTLAVGGVGVISVISHVCPKDVVAMCNQFFEGNVAKARQHAAATLPFARLLFMDSNPQPVKTALAAMGLIDEEWRLPMGPMPADKRQLLLKELAALGVELKHGS